MLFVEVIIIAASVLYDGVKTTCSAKTIQRSLSAVSSWDEIQQSETPQTRNDPKS